MKWLPICTAPTDGKDSILLAKAGFEPAIGSYYVERGVWTTEAPDSEHMEQWCDENDYQPDFWMPISVLPSVPPVPPV